MFRKNLIRAAIILFITFIAAGNLYSQRMPGDRAGRMADRLYRDLQLTDEQYTRVYQALLEYETQVDGMTTTGTTTTGTTGTTTTSTTGSTTTTGTNYTDRLNSSMRGILTPDQMTYYTNYDSNRRSGIRFNGTTRTNTNTNTGNNNNSGNNNNNNNNNSGNNRSGNNSNDVNNNFKGTNPPGNDVTSPSEKTNEDTNKQMDDLKDSGKENHDNKRMDDKDTKIEDKMNR